MRRDVKLTTTCKQTAVLALFLLGAACGAGDHSDTHTFLLRSGEVNLQEATGEVLQVLVLELRAQDVLQSEYPMVGLVATAPDPSDPGVELLACREGGSDDPEATACILLDQSGDFVRVLPVTWQSAAPYMYRIYISPRSLFARVDPAKDFVAIDVYLLQEPGLWEPVAQAIGDAADHLGARPFRP